jgi:hypothetical protein
MTKPASVLATFILAFAAPAHAEVPGQAWEIEDAAAGAKLTGGTLGLDPLLPGGGGTSTSSRFRLTGSVGQPSVTPSNALPTTLRPGFWTQSGVVRADALFAHGFE